MSRPRVVLFDIDNTLLYTGGAGSYAMNLAFDRLFGVPDGFARIEFSGRTDRYILQEGLSGRGIEGGAEKHLAAFTETYYALLPRAMAERESQLMPGFPELLSALREGGARLGLATGNFSEAARIKLDYLGLSEYFEGGGFGEESVERSDVVASAIRTVADGSRADDILVVGDTPHDITAALDNGVIAIGVATGNYGVEQLRESGAHVVFQDFADWQTAAEQLLNGS